MLRRFSSLLNISPLDGRYRSMLGKLPDLLSESGLIRHRVRIEVSWFLHLAKHGIIKTPEGEHLSLPPSKISQLESLWQDFSLEAAEWVKIRELETNHDLKAVEYYIMAHSPFKEYSEYFHILCTSEDINNLAYSLMFKECLNEVLLPCLCSLHKKLEGLAVDNAEVPMLSRTHGQPASPTTVGKEFANFAYRIKRQIQHLEAVELTGKCNGAVGNFNVHVITFPEQDWVSLSKAFIEELGLHYNPYTTQIEPHDVVAELCGVLAQVNTILLDLARDMWGYISLGYFKAIIKPGEVGSSTMPHKVNPIDFENAEGNLGISNALLVHLQHKLPISRFQRDLSDSTAIRNVGVGLGHAMVAYKSMIRGLEKIHVNYDKLDQELDMHWEILAEPVQMILRKYNYPQPYELLKTYTRGKGNLNQEQYRELIKEIVKELGVKEEVVKELSKLTPAKYVGLAGSLAKNIRKI